MSVLSCWLWGPGTAIESLAIVAVMAAVQPHPVNHAVVSFVVSFTYVRTHPAHTTQNRHPRL